MAEGWMPGVLHAPTEAKGGYGIPDGGMKPNAVVVHTIEGWQHVMMSPSWTKNSYHFTLRLDGRIVQHVSVYTPAWHAGLETNDPRPTWWTLSRPMDSPNTHTLGLSAEGSAVSGTGLPLAWTEGQVESAIKVLRWIAEETGIAFKRGSSLVQHSALVPHRRQDPGARWPEARVLEALQPAPKPAPSSQLSRAVDLNEVYGMVTDAFVPAYLDDKTTWSRLPMLGGRRRYLLEVEDR